MKWFFAVFFSSSFVFLAIFGINCLYGVLFPIKFQDEISYASQKYDLEEAVIYSMINIESRFDKNAVSSKGAVGLMQVMPSTAQEVANSMGRSQFDLYYPQDNILIGAKYLVFLLNKFDNLETALAGYNAGPANVSAWLKNSEYSDDEKTLKKIPFEETEKYIQKFKKNYKYYSEKLKN